TSATTCRNNCVAWSRSSMLRIIVALAPRASPVQTTGCAAARPGLARPKMGSPAAAAMMQIARRRRIASAMLMSLHVLIERYVLQATGRRLDVAAQNVVLRHVVEQNHAPAVLIRESIGVVLA